MNSMFQKMLKIRKDFCSGLKGRHLMGEQ